MKITIITPCYNSERTIEQTILSVCNQDYNDIEFIIVDGKSTDRTTEIAQRYNKNISLLISEPDGGIYDAINKGILNATGDIIGILNSDDFFADKDVLSRVAEYFLNEDSVDMIYGDIAFVQPGKTDKIVRYYSSSNFSPNKFTYGFMPAHPSCYMRRTVYERFGNYKTTYKIAADYEFLIRVLHVGKIKAMYVDMLFVMMSTGGVSNKAISSRYVLNKEIVHACKQNGIYTNLFILSFKYFLKVFEYFRPHKRIAEK